MSTNRIFVVGKYTGTRYGPFGTEAEAQAFIRHELGSSTRFYETGTPASPEGAVSPVVRRALAFRDGRGYVQPKHFSLGDRVPADRGIRA